MAGEGGGLLGRARVRGPDRGEWAILIYAVYYVLHIRVVPGRARVRGPDRRRRRLFYSYGSLTCYILHYITYIYIVCVCVCDVRGRVRVRGPDGGLLHGPHRRPHLLPRRPGRRCI